MRRSYGQYCATARTLDVVGERWTLLIVRELLTGPKRFKDLADALPGIGTGLLAARLKHLEAEGLARKAKLSLPAKTEAYELTEAGEDLGPPVLALARWGLKWALGERRDGEVFPAGGAVFGLQALFQPEAAAELDLVYEWRIGDSTFHVHVDHGTIETSCGPAQRPDAVIEGSEEIFCEMSAGSIGLRRAVAEGRATVRGDAAALAALRELFVWPERRVAAAPLPGGEATAS
jgi:DNA-binding HxlR family transcriptional regulator